MTDTIEAPGTAEEILKPKDTAARVAYAKRSTVASGFDTTRPLERVSVGGPNLGSAAATRVMIGPVHGPVRNT